MRGGGKIDDQGEYVDLNKRQNIYCPPLKVIKKVKYNNPTAKIVINNEASYSENSLVKVEDLSIKYRAVRLTFIKNIETVYLLVDKNNSGGQFDPSDDPNQPDPSQGGNKCPCILYFPSTRYSVGQSKVYYVSKVEFQYPPELIAAGYKDPITITVQNTNYYTNSRGICEVSEQKRNIEKHTLRPGETVYSYGHIDNCGNGTTISGATMSPQTINYKNIEYSGGKRTIVPDIPKDNHPNFPDRPLIPN